MLGVCVFYGTASLMVHDFPIVTTDFPMKTTDFPMKTTDLILVLPLRVVELRGPAAADPTPRSVFNGIILISYIEES